MYGEHCRYTALGNKLRFFDTRPRKNSSTFVGHFATTEAEYDAEATAADSLMSHLRTASGVKQTQALIYVLKIVFHEFCSRFETFDELKIRFADFAYFMDDIRERHMGT
jgi:hypothetical protein